MLKGILFVTFFLLFFIGTNGQRSFRFKSEIVLKAKSKTGELQYTKGIVHYDLRNKKLLFDISFPQKEFYVSKDTLIYKYQNTKLVSVQNNPIKPEFSIFQFILNNDLSDFGLKNSSFSISNVEKSNGLVITKWVPPAVANFPIGNILISTKDKRLQSVLIYNKKGELLSRQIYKGYNLVNGVGIPSEILSVSYNGNLKTYQIMNISHVLINETENDNDYDFKAEGALK